jgi:hypothetical protein
MSIYQNETFLFHDIAPKNYLEYGKIQKKLGIVLLKRIFVFIYNTYLFDVNTLINKEITIKRIWDKDFLKKLLKHHICVWQ